MVLGPKSKVMPTKVWLRTVKDQGFLTRYYTALFLKRLQKCRQSKIVFYISYSKSALFWLGSVADTVIPWEVRV